MFFFLDIIYISRNIEISTILQYFLQISKNIFIWGSFYVEFQFQLVNFNIILFLKKFLFHRSNNVQNCKFIYVTYYIHVTLLLCSDSQIIFIVLKLVNFNIILFLKKFFFHRSNNIQNCKFIYVTSYWFSSIVRFRTKIYVYSIISPKFIHVVKISNNNFRVNYNQKSTL